MKNPGLHRRGSTPTSNPVVPALCPTNTPRTRAVKIRKRVAFARGLVLPVRPEVVLRIHRRLRPAVQLAAVLVLVLWRRARRRRVLRRVVREVGRVVVRRVGVLVRGGGRRAGDVGDARGVQELVVEGEGEGAEEGGEDCGGDGAVRLLAFRAERKGYVLISMMSEMISTKESWLQLLLHPGGVQVSNPGNLRPRRH